MIRTRFAPSPTGLLHVGNVRTALFNWLFTRHGGGTFVLRIEDTDVARSSPEFEAGILREMEWLGLDWDEGGDKGGPYAPYRQSERNRQGIYLREFNRLLDRGMVYYCFCTPEQIEADRQACLEAGKPPQYSGRCRGLDPAVARARKESGEPYACRFKVPEQKVSFRDQIRGDIEIDSTQIGDPVVFRSDGWPTYNFAVVVDDIEMKITHVIRGEDHISNTPRQILLYRALDCAPPQFAHLPLVLGPDHAPLSKRHGDTSLRQYIEKGYLPEAMFNYLALLGWSSPAGKEILNREELAVEFDLHRVGKSAGIFDRAKLDWVANQHLRKADSSRLAQRCIPFLKASGDFPENLSDGHRVWVERLMDLLKESIAHLSEAPGSEAIQVLLHFDASAALRDPEVAAELRDPACGAVLAGFARLVFQRGALDAESFRQVASELGKELGLKGRALYHPIRLALTARAKGPELARLVPLIEGAASLELPRKAPGCARRAAAMAELAGGGR
jgi:nondiscriminating glutamyl-tRNA synthetase